MIKMKKIYLILIIGLFFISFASAQDEQSWGYVKANHCISLTQTCGNCTFVNITGITYPNKTELTLSEPIEMQNLIGTRYNHSFCDTSAYGEYIISGDHNLDGEIDSWNANFISNYSGKELSISQSILYLGLIAIFILILFATFFGMNLLPKSNTTNEEGKILSINYLKYLRLPLWLFAYFLFIAIVFLSSNIAFAFLSEQLFGKMLFAIYSILFVLAPVVIILILISFFLRFFQDKEFQKLINRGIFPQGKF